MAFPRKLTPYHLLSIVDPFVIREGSPSAKSRSGPSKQLPLEKDRLRHI
jgi:hypothetical protein